MQIQIISCALRKVINIFFILEFPNFDTKWFFSTPLRVKVHLVMVPDLILKCSSCKYLSDHANTKKFHVLLEKLLISFIVKLPNFDVPFQFKTGEIDDERINNNCYDDISNHNPIVVK